MSYILFNGYDSRQYGYVKFLPAPVIAANDYTVATAVGIPPIIYDYGSYSTKQISFTIGTVGRQRAEAVLKHFTGHGDLIISDHPDRKITAWCMDGITPDRKSNRFTEITLNYTCYAYSELLREKQIKPTISESSGTIAITEYDTARVGDIPATPMIYFMPAATDATTSFSVGGAVFYINTGLATDRVYCIDTRWSRLVLFGTLENGVIKELPDEEKVDLSCETYGDFSSLYLPASVKCEITYENLSFLSIKRCARFLL